jgi:hypothetical protein
MSSQKFLLTDNNSKNKVVSKIEIDEKLIGNFLMSHAEKNLDSYVKSVSEFLGLDKKEELPNLVRDSSRKSRFPFFSLFS